MDKVRCPICDAAMPGNRKDYPDYPFCSRRCRLVDLGRWLGEGYRLGGPNATADDDRSTDADVSH
ncbi:MAG: DNA gyrase inhibitor YacG [Gemmataceae bacterium]